MSVHYNQAFPVCHIVMARKTEEAYAAVFQFCKSMMENMQTTVNIITDFEKSMQNAARSVFVGFSVRGCWFHFAACLFKKAKKLGLYRRRQNRENIRLTIRMAMALPLLPSENINEGFNAIVLFTDASGIGAEMMTFLKYLRSTWILGVGPETLSVFGQPSRTNNFQEAYHMELKRLMGIHPGVWQFTDSLRHQEERKVKTFAALANGRRTHQGRKKQYIERDRHICDAQRSLRNGAYSVEEFLRAVALRRIAEEEERIAAMRENDPSSEEENSEDEDEPEIVGDEGLANVGRVAVNNNEEDIADVVEGLAFDEAVIDMQVNADEEDIADVVEGLAFDEAVIDMQVNADENGDIEPQFAVDDDDVVDAPHNGHEPRNRCTVCWEDHVASFICVPCGHICLCPTCAATISGKPTAAERVCPFCKTETITIIRAYQDL